MRISVSNMDLLFHRNIYSLQSLAFDRKLVRNVFIRREAGSQIYCPRFFFFMVVTLRLPMLRLF